MPRLTSRVFTDLAIWMMGFGLLIGVVFPPFCLLLGFSEARAMQPDFIASKVVAGLMVGAVNYSLSPRGRAAVAPPRRTHGDRGTPARGCRIHP